MRSKLCCSANRIVCNWLRIECTFSASGITAAQTISATPATRKSHPGSGLKNGNVTRIPIESADCPSNDEENNYRNQESKSCAKQDSKTPPANSRVSQSVAVPQPNPSNQEFAAIAFASPERPTRGHIRSANCSAELCTVQKKRKVHWSEQACKSRMNNRRMRCQLNAPFGRRRFFFHGESVESARPGQGLVRRQDLRWGSPQVVVVSTVRACRHQIQDSTVHRHYEEAKIEKYSMCFLFVLC